MRVIENCNVCVIGGAGFLGSHLVQHLIEDRKCNVLVLDNLCVGRREFIHPKAKFEHCDITGSESQIHKLFKHHRISFVFNYAAHPYVPFSYERPLYVCDTNGMAAIKVINAAQEAGVEGILQVSSAEVYGCNRIEDKTKISEDPLKYPVTPHSSYGVSKAMVDGYCQVAYKERKTPVIALRQFNCVGERETHPYVIPEIIGQIARIQAVIGQAAILMLGNNSFRDFLYAGDAVRMAVELLEKGQFGEVYNLGSETGVHIYELAEMIGRLMGFKSVLVVTDPKRVRPWEIWRLCSDNEKVYSVISYRPAYSLEEALKVTIQYFEHRGRKWVWEDRN